MLTMLHRAVDLIQEHNGITVDLAVIPQEDEVYELLCRANTVGVQVESRARMRDAAPGTAMFLRSGRRGCTDQTGADPKAGSVRILCCGGVTGKKK